MMQLVALLDLPARDQLTRVRLVLRRDGILSTSGTNPNTELAEHEIHELEQHGVLLRWADTRPFGLEMFPNPAGFWMGAEVLRHNDKLASNVRFPVPRHAVTVATSTWNGVLWIQEPGTIAQQREAWIRILAQRAMLAVAADERRGLWRLMLATLPAHELTRAVALHTFDEDQSGRAWLERQLAAEGRPLTGDALTSRYQELKGLAGEARDQPIPIRTRSQLLLPGRDARPWKRCPGFDQREAA